jgi:hypothetical protein
MKHALIIAAALFAAAPAWANPPGYDSSWTSKEAADAALAADQDYAHCVFHPSAKLRQEDPGASGDDCSGVPCGVLDGAR